MTVVEERVNELSAGLTGRLVRPDDTDYDEVRRIHNGLIDRRPALIARCRNAAEVARAILFAKESGLEISVRGGGHNVAGRAVTEGGLMIDLAEMRGIKVDPDARTARAEAGLNWREFNDATAKHGLGVTGGAVSTTGIAGLTLGGGLGWLMGVHGLAADNVLSIELVTAGGEILDVTQESHPDLFWALRGGGGNFGVATSFEYRLHPVGQVVGGLAVHPFAAAADVLRFYRDFTASVPDELTVYTALTHAPDGSGAKIAAIAVCHIGEQEQAEADIAPVRAFGEPLMVEIGPMPYPVMNTLLDDGYPKGALNYWKSSFLASFDDDMIDTVVEQFTSTPSPMNAVLIEHVHGEVTRIPVESAAVGQRREGYNVLIPSVWTDPADTEGNVAWTRAAFAALEPYFRKGRWLNYFDDDEPTSAIREAYGPNYERLVDVKQRYDPENVFHLNQNIDPAG
jgi:FAD/FMN-containing dehydrogenase